MAVVLFHAEMPGFRGGFVGVDVFFVISGFLITGLLWREVSSTGSVRFGRFYGARARRLLPASALVGIVIMLAAVLVQPPLQAQGVIDDGIASALYVSNYRFAFQGVDYLASLAPPSPFQHYWSLGVEEQFYLVWAPLILGTAWLIRRARKTASADATTSPRPYLVVLGVVAAVSFVLSVIVTHWAPSFAFFSLPTRAWQLAVGGLVALTALHWRRLPPRAAHVTGWAGLALIALACVWLKQTTPYPGWAAVLPTLGALLVIGAGCATPEQGCGRLLKVRPIQWLGRISYSLYLWHWPLLLMALWAVAPVTGHALYLGAAAIVLSVVLAALTLRFVENPLRYASKIRNSPSRSLAVGGIATAVAVCVGFALQVPNPVGSGAPAAALAVTSTPIPPGADAATYDAALKNAMAQVQAAVAASAGLKAVPSNLTPALADAAQNDDPDAAPAGCIRTYFEVGQPDCMTGDLASPTTVALIGDSNAAMWNPAFQQLARQRHWRLETMAKLGCPMLDLPTLNPVLGRPYTECAQWRDQVLTRLQTQHPQLIVFSVMRRYGAGYGWKVGFTSYEPEWLVSMTRLVQQLRATGAQVLVIGPIPGPQTATPNCLSVHLDDATACSTPKSLAANQTGIAAEEDATKAGGGQYADLTTLFCTPDVCPPIVGNTLVYSDKNHITLQYARVLAPVIGALTDRTLARGH
ncbi:acyltransferase family protein [Mycolicibacterium psychrotolerans]|uniref:acyltransferase family protein n=1 Tax=Mycolicibacterium psychrotolerans TaxID=216929 RepID=UPI003D66A84C